MLKCLRIAVTVLSLTACIVFIVLWARSRYTLDYYFNIASAFDIKVLSCQGKAFVSIEKGMTLSQNTAILERFRKASQAVDLAELQKRRLNGDCPIPETNLFGFRWWSWNRFIIPYWLTVVLTATLGVVPWLKRRFSLRTLLIATTLVAVVLGIIVMAR